MILSTIVVHPKYRRNGYATKLVRHIERIADEDNVKLGVSASQMGKPLMERCGFEKRYEIKVPGYRHHEESTTLWLGSRSPQNLHSTWGNRLNQLNQLISILRRKFRNLVSSCSGVRQPVQRLKKLS